MQPVLKKHMPHLKKTGRNRFEWISDDREVVQPIEQTGNTGDSWFYARLTGIAVFSRYSHGVDNVRQSEQSGIVE